MKNRSGNNFLFQKSYIELKSGNMTNRRRDFLKMIGLAGLSVVVGGIKRSYASESMNHGEPNLPQAIHEYEEKRVQYFNMSGYAVPKIDTVRVGIIGLGKRGPGHMRTLSCIDVWKLKPYAI